MCDRSILGLNSSLVAAEREARDEPPSCCSKYFLTRSASSSSMELECVFFSVMPILGRTSRISLLFTSSSRARSLIRILCCIAPRFLRICPRRGPRRAPVLRLAGGIWLCLHSILTVVVSFLEGAQL